MMLRRWGTILLLVGTACVDREFDDEVASQTDSGSDAPGGSGDASSEGENAPNGPGGGGGGEGARPTEGMYQICEVSDHCGDLEFCVSPADELGFCTEACANREDPGSCEPGPGGSAQRTCLEIGTPDGRRVCALDCGSDRTCPKGMRCERVQTADGGRSICF